jgi:hypothetical protein
MCAAISARERSADVRSRAACMCRMWIHRRRMHCGRHGNDDPSLCGRDVVQIGSSVRGDLRGEPCDMRDSTTHTGELHDRNGGRPKGDHTHAGRGLQRGGRCRNVVCARQLTDALARRLLTFVRSRRRLRGDPRRQPVHMLLPTGGDRKDVACEIRIGSRGGSIALRAREPGRWAAGMSVPGGECKVHCRYVHGRRRVIAE